MKSKIVDTIDRTVSTPAYVTEWEWTDIALRAIRKTIAMMYDNEPDKKDSTNRLMWEQEMREIRKWAVDVHNRRIKCNICKLRGE